MRLVCLPHGGGGAQAFAAWPAALPVWLEVVAYQPPGRGPRSREAAVEDMARLSEQLLPELTPYLDLPFMLFGHSVGALVAFELARHLEKAGLRPLHVIVSGHPEPEAATRSRDTADGSDDDLIASIAALGLLPADALDMPGLRELVLPPVRADYHLAEHYRLEPTARIGAPLTAFGGTEDPLVAMSELDGWRKRTAAGFELRPFPGGHFFTESARESVLASIGEIASSALASLPPSVLVGESEDYPLATCLHELFRAQAAKSPSDTAVVGTDRSLDFATLDRESDLLARALIARGCGIDRFVAILMETSVEFVVAYLAILKAGGAYLPIPPVTPVRSIGEILEGTNPVAIVTRPALAQSLPPSWRDETRCVVLDEDWQARLAAERLPSQAERREQPGPLSLAYCVMTSGTTGKPKGIICPHQGAVNSYWWRFVHLPYGEAEREACNVFFVWEVLRPLLQGRPAYVIPDDVIFDPRRLVAFLEQHRITRVLFTPSLFERLLAYGEDLAERLATLRMVILNGEVVSLALAERASQLLPHVVLVNDYSISECHDVTTSRIGDAAASPVSRTLPAGKVMANVRVYVLGEDLAPVPHGVPGEVYVAGPTLARGYLNLPEETAARFLPDPIQGGHHRMFRTGDIGRVLPDGQLEIRGRARFMIKLRGYSVVPSAVEAAIATHPVVSAVVVVTVDDPATGQPESLAAYVAGHARAPTAHEIADLRRHLKERLPAYAIPAHIVALPALPIQATTGKVDRKRLPPVSALPRAEVAPVRPGATTHEIEPRMRDLWSKVLGRSPSNPDDNFFDLGGHSLLAIELARGTEDAFHVRVDVVDVFNHATLSAYCRHVAARMSPGAVAPAIQRTRASDIPSAAARIAVVGMACRFPGASDPEGLWDKLVRGVECVRTFTAAELAGRGVPQPLIDDESYVRAGAVLDDVALFDARFFGISEREATLMDPQQRLFIECCHEALERAGHAADTGRLLTGVWAGCYLPSYLVHHLGARRHLDPADPTSFHLAEIGNDKDYLASRAAFLLGLEGPAISVQTSCSTGLVAIAEAAAALQAGRCDMALAGASSITFPQGGYLYVEGHIGSRSGHCRSFDATADGTILGDGVGVVVLRRLDEALADGNQVLAVIEGYAVNNDGAAKAGYSAPSGRGQARVIAAALDIAGIDAGSVGCIEAHGTATVIGDPIEVRALAETYGRRTEEQGACILGSVKANLGHSNIAAGVAGFIKSVLTLHHRRFAPQINFTTANPELRLAETPFRILTEARDWVAAPGVPRRAAVSSFGIGGTNAHMVLVEAPEAKGADETPPRSQILPLSAKSAPALARLAEQMATHLEAAPKADLAAVAATLQVGRVAHPVRRAVVATTCADAARALSAPATAHGTSTGEGVVFVFPGQGSQHPGMAADLLGSCPAFARHFERAAGLFRVHGIEIAGLADPISAVAVLATAPGLQAALFATEWALAGTLIGFGVTPRALAGHSLGQIVAAAVGGILALEEAVALVAVRAAAMEAAPAGAMMTVSAPLHDVRELIAAYPGIVVAAINTPHDIVVAGPVNALARLERAASGARLPTQRLAVSRAFHSPMMHDAAAEVAEAASRMRLSPPRIPVACNCSGGWMSDEAIKDPGHYWRCHMLAPVDFAANTAAILALAPAAVVEAGPGRALTRLISAAASDTGRDLAVLPSLRHPRDGSVSDTEMLDRCLAHLWEAGCDIDWHAYRDGRPPRRVVLPTYPFERRRYWPKNDVAFERDGQRGEPERKLPWQERFYVPSLRRASTPVQADESWRRQSWLLLLGGREEADQVGQALIQALKAAGHDAEVLYRGAGPGVGQEVIDAIERLGCADAEPRILCTWPYFAANGGAEAQDLAGPLVELASALARRSTLRTLQLHVLAKDALAAPGEPLKTPVVSTVLGPLLSLGQEDPTLTARLIDIAAVSDSGNGWNSMAREIVAEITAANPRPEPQFAVRGGVRWSERFDPLQLGEAQRDCGRNRLRQGPHVITGGLGRIGLALARHLVGLGADVVLVTRRPIPARENWAALADAAGTDAMLKALLDALVSADCGTGRLSVVTAEVTDAEAMTRLLRDIARQKGRIGGIFHAAGLARLTDIADATGATLAAELAPKEQGTCALEAALFLAPPADFVMLFSSLAGTLGGLGLGAYAAANRYLDAFVQVAPVRSGVPWISVAWDDWDFDYGAAQPAAYARTREGLAIAPAEGMVAIEAILGEPELYRVLVSATPLEARMQRWLVRPQHIEAVPLTSVEPPAEPSSAWAEPLSPNQARVQAAYAKVLGAPDAGLDDNFFDLGGDSLMATQIVLELGRGNARQGPRLRVTDVFDFPSVRSLAALLSAEQTPLNHVAE